MNYFSQPLDRGYHQAMLMQPCQERSSQPTEGKALACKQLKTGQKICMVALTLEQWKSFTKFWARIIKDFSFRLSA